MCSCQAAVTRPMLRCAAFRDPLELSRPRSGCSAMPRMVAHCSPARCWSRLITNVGWTPLFPRAAAVVTDVGAPLSHAAIVARELGIPAVVGCGNATMRLRTGDLVRVDGTAGTVEVLR